MGKLYKYLRAFFTVLGDDEITVYSAYASFYMVISFVPFLMIFLMIAGNFISITSSDFELFIGHNLPKSLIGFISYIINEILNSGPISLISLPAVTLVWTASRCVVAIAKGLDSVYKVKDRRSFIKLNAYGILYTVIFFAAILFSLILMVFGNLIADTIGAIFPVAIEILNLILSSRGIIFLVVLTALFICMYTFVPGRKLKFFKQLPGAVFSASGWMIFSLLFSIYVDNFDKRSYVYGSLTTLVIFMLWVYFCMVIVFLGGEINYFLMQQKGEIDN